MYLESSKDILNLVLAFCVLWFTAFLCWLLWYIISILRDVSKLIREIHEKITAIDHAVRMVREKIEGSLGAFGVAASGLRMLGGYLDKRKGRLAEDAMDAARKIKKKVSKVKKRLKEELDDEEDETEDLS